MIVEQPTDRMMQTNVGGEAIVMAVDQSAMQHIMYLLRNAYSDSEYAVIREYSTNAHDAHVEAGVSRPIEVWTPNPSPLKTDANVLRIKDYGVGLDLDGIREVYSQYGASTKRASNDFNGALGIGCKSALAYAQQFTVIATKNGKQHTVLVALDNDGVGSMTIVATVDTDEPNGVEVAIPVKAQNNMEAKARKFFRAWEPGTVLLNGQQPEPFDGLKVGDNMLVREDSDEPDYVVMGNVPYPVEQGKIKHGLTRGGYVGNSYTRSKPYSLVVYVNIGEVTFPPSREALDYEHSRTKTTLQRIAGEFKANVEGAIQKAMNEAKTPGEAIEVLTKFNRMVENLDAKTYTYKGKTVPSKVVPADGEVITLVPLNGYYGNSSNEQQSIGARFIPKTLFVSGYDLVKFAADHKRKLVKFLEDNGMDSYITHIALTDTPIKLDWTEDEQHVEWADIRAIRLNPTVAGITSSRIPGSYDVIVKGSSHPRMMKGDDLNLKEPIFYRGQGKYSGQRYAEILRHFHPDCQIVCMGSNRVAKFVRLVPKAEECRDAVERLHKEWIKKMPADQAKALAISIAGHTSALKALDGSKVKDPEVKAAIRLAKIDLTNIDRERRLFRNLGFRLHDLPGFKNPLTKYPLYGEHQMRSCPADVYIYMNAAYAARKEG